MGITGLLPLLKPVTQDTHVRELKGLTVGIDTYCWLHKAIYSCSAELCQGIPTDKFIKYCVERVHLLLRYGVTPYLVFDGGHLPAKAGKEAERRAKRETNMQRGVQLLREGNSAGAHQSFCKAADVTPFMAHQLIQVIKRIPGVKYVVAPYEADAQLGFLARNGHVDCVITEDSDIILFGCTRVLFKLGRDGTGQEVDLQHVFSRRNDELDMRGMTQDDLMTLCALSGCDYLPSVHGVGLKKAHRLVSRHKELSKILRALKFEASEAFPLGYEADFQRALLTFRHQRAFDPVTRTVVHMTPLPEAFPDVLTALGTGDNMLDFLGPPVDAERGCLVADAEIDPITGERFSEMSSGKPTKDGGAAREAPLSDSAAVALASWRGTTSTFGSKAAGSNSVKKNKLCGQGNNLTKYWGAPAAKTSPSTSSSLKENKIKDNLPRKSDNVCDGGVGGRGRQAMDVDPCFEADATLNRRREGTAGGGDDEGECGAGVITPKALKGETGCNLGTSDDSSFRGYRHDPETTNARITRNPDFPVSCVSPGGFYGGLSPSRTPQARTSRVPSVDYDPSDEDKENRDPSLALDDKSTMADKEDDTEISESATSKHFSGGGGSCSSGGPAGGRPGRLARTRKMTPSSAAGLSRRFRSPLVSTSKTAGGLNTNTSIPRTRLAPGDGRIDYDVNGGGLEDDTVVRRGNPWGAQYACPAEGIAVTEINGGRGSGRGGVRASRGLKRRRTLGVGSVAPLGLLRGLDGVAMLEKRAGDGGLHARRSKSLGGGTMSLSRSGVSASVPDGDDAAFASQENMDSANNLFERFARTPMGQPSDAGNTTDFDMRVNASERETVVLSGIEGKVEDGTETARDDCRSLPLGTNKGNNGLSSTDADGRSRSSDWSGIRNITAEEEACRDDGGVSKGVVRACVAGGQRVLAKGGLSERSVNVAVSSCPSKAKFQQREGSSLDGDVTRIGNVQNGENLGGHEDKRTTVGPGDVNFVADGVGKENKSAGDQRSGVGLQKHGSGKDGSGGDRGGAMGQAVDMDVQDIFARFTYTA